MNPPLFISSKCCSNKKGSTCVLKNIFFFISFSNCHINTSGPCDTLIIVTFSRSYDYQLNRTTQKLHSTVWPSLSAVIYWKRCIILPSPLNSTRHQFYHHNKSKYFIFIIRFSLFLLCCYSPGQSLSFGFEFVSTSKATTCKKRTDSDLTEKWTSKSGMLVSRKYL